jgi:hypothetical protein
MIQDARPHEIKNWLRVNSWRDTPYYRTCWVPQTLECRLLSRRSNCLRVGRPWLHYRSQHISLPPALLSKFISLQRTENRATHLNPVLRLRKCGGIRLFASLPSPHTSSLSKETPCFLPTRKSRKNCYCETRCAKKSSGRTSSGL